MASQVNGSMVPAAGDALRQALLKNKSAVNAAVTPAAVPAKLTETGTPQAAKGVSIQDQMSAMLAEMRTMKAELETARSAKPAKAGKPAKAAKSEPIAETGPWYARKAYLGRADKTTGKSFYDVDLDSVMATEDIAIMRSNAFSDTLLFIKGKRKPVYLSVDAIEALILDFPTVEKFVDTNEKYLAQCRADKKAESE